MSIKDFEEDFVADGKMYLETHKGDSYFVFRCGEDQLTLRMETGFWKNGSPLEKHIDKYMANEKPDENRKKHKESLWRRIYRFITEAG